MKYGKERGNYKGEKSQTRPKLVLIGSPHTIE